MADVQDGLQEELVWDLQALRAADVPIGGRASGMPGGAAA